MRKLILAAAVLALFVMPALADMEVQMHSTGGGSPYVATVRDVAIPGHAVGTSFDTFCLEEVEYFYEGHTYHLTLDPYAIRGGTDSDSTMGDGKDYVDIRTAWLYGNYLASTGGVSAYSANQIQDVIWYIEAEKSLSSLTTPEKDLLALADAGGAVWGTDFHGVMAMNLFGNSGDFNPAQSQLVQVPTVVEVPAPGAVLLGALGLGLVGLIRNRRKA